MTRFEPLEDRRLLAPVPFPSPLTAQGPAGSLVYEGTLTADISLAGEVDHFTLDLDPGQTVTVAVEPAAGLQPYVQLLDPSGLPLGQAIAATPGRAVLLQNVGSTESGSYSFYVAGPAGSSGAYTVRVVLNAAVEGEAYSGISNDDVASAEDLGPSFLSLGSETASRGAVLGSLEGSAGDFYRIDATAQESIALVAAAAGDGQVDVQLVDAAQDVLAWGISTENADSAISDFVVPATGSYWIRVSGTGDYSLVVTRGAGFELEPNDAPQLASQLPPSGTVLGGLPGPSREPSAVGVSNGGENPSVAGASEAGSSPSQQAGLSIYYPGRLIVQFTEETAGIPMEVLVASRGGRLIRELPSIRGALIELPNPAIDVIFAAAAWSADSSLYRAEPDYLVHSFDTIPDDPDFARQWGLHNTGQTGGTEDSDVDAPYAWDFHTGASEVVVAVIDSGVDYTHEDLAANMWANPGEIPDDGIDNDGNGYIDDVHGIDLVNGDSEPLDDRGHGTHVAGILGAVGNNGIGVTGAAWSTQIMAMKFLDDNGSGFVSDAITSLEYITTMKTAYGVNVVASNNSWGGGEYSEALRNAILASNEAGILFVASAGNLGLDCDAVPSYPGSYDLDGVIAVAAVDHNDEIAAFSNYGGTSVDLAAPGVNILSTSPGNQYEELSGTSMAAPFVTGAAALLAAGNPGATVAEVRAALLENVDIIPALQGRVASGGRLNLASALISQRDPGDYYRVAAHAGDSLQITTSTPNVQGGESANALNPAIELYDPQGVLVAADTDSATDGRNAQLVHNAVEAGDYLVRVVAEAGVFENAEQQQGEYVLRVQGATGSNRPPEVIGAAPNGGQKIGYFPTVYTLDFSEAILATSLDAGDLLIGGLPAVSATAIDGNTFRFEVDPAANTGDGVYAVEMPQGSVRDLQGMGNVVLSSSFEFDTVGPRIVATSWNGQSLRGYSQDHGDIPFTEGPLTFVAFFDEDLASGSGVMAGGFDPDPDDIVLHETFSGEYFLPTSMAYDPASRSFSASYDALSEGIYTLELISGDGAFEDLAGNHLDGEPIGASPDGTTTGDGNPGGSYRVLFSVDSDVTEAAEFQWLRPLGSMMSGSMDTWGLINSSSDEDAFHFYALGGHAVSITAYPEDPDGLLSLELPGLSGISTAAASGEPVTVGPVVIPADGHYTIRVRGDMLSPFYLDIARNYITEVFDSADGSELSLDASRLDVGSARYAVVATARPNGPVADVDEFTIDFTGKLGAPIDVILAGQGSLDFSTATLQLLDTDGSTVLATAVSDPLGADTTNYDLAILDFHLPSDGVYTMRIESTQSGDYGLVVTESVLFDSEPNNEPARPLRSFNGLSTAMGFLDGYGAPLLFAAEFSFSSPITIHVLDPLTGEVYNSFPSPDIPPTNPYGLNLAFDGRRLFFNSGGHYGDNTIYVLDARDGTLLNSFVAEASLGVLGLAYLDDTLYVMDFRGGYSSGRADIDVYDATTFEYIRSMPAPSRSLTGFSGDDAHHVLYGADQFGNTLIRIDPDTGLPLDAALSGLAYEQGMAVLGGELYVSDSLGLGHPVQDVVVYDSATFARIRQFTLPIDTMIGGLGGDGVLAEFDVVMSHLRAMAEPPLTGDAHNLPGAPADEGSAARGDLYRIELSAGDPLTVFTRTPFLGTGESALFRLDPSLTIIGPSVSGGAGEPVATDLDSMPDGRNALVSFLAPEDGTYLISVDSESGQGEYLLKAIRTIEPALAINDVAVLEGDIGTVEVQFTISLSDEWYEPVSVQVDTADGTAVAADGDYDPIDGLILTFDPGDPLTQTVSVSIASDEIIESDETFSIHLSSPVSAKILQVPPAAGDAGQGVGTILNDDADGLSLWVYDMADNHDISLARKGPRLELRDNLVPGEPLGGQSRKVTEFLLLAGSNDHDDRFVVDFSTANPMPDQGVLLHAGYGGNDQLETSGGAFSTIRLDYTTVTPGSLGGNGSIDLDGSLLSYAELERLTINSSADQLQFHLPSDSGSNNTAANQVVLFSLGNGSLRLESTNGLFAATELVSPNGGILLQGGDADDVFRLEDLSASFGGSVRIDTGAGADQIVLAESAVLNEMNAAAAAILMPGDTLLGSGTVDRLLQVAAGASVAPGYGTNGSHSGVLYTAGLSFEANATLVVELGGTTAGVSHDQVSVNGGITIDPAAVLDLSLVFDPAPGDRFTILENDGTADPISGRFAGFRDDVPIRLTGSSGQQIPFLADYHGGDGNDLELTALTFDTVYVDDDFANPFNGEDPDGVEGSPRYFGFDAFATIQEAIDVVADGGTVRVLPGMYAEDLLIEHAGLELAGADDADPSLTVIQALLLSTSPAMGTSADRSVLIPNIAILANEVHVHGLTFRGPDPAAGSFAAGMVIGGNDVMIDHSAFEVTSASSGNDVSLGLQTYDDVDNPVAQYPVAQYPVAQYPVAEADGSGLSVHHNTFTAHGDGTAGYDAIYLPAAAVPTGSISIETNRIDGTLELGIRVERSNVRIAQNTIIGTAGQGGGSQAVRIGSAESSPVDVVVEGNTMSDHAVGVVIAGGDVALTGNDYVGSHTAIRVSGGVANVQESIGQVDTGVLITPGGSAIVDGSTIAGNDIGIDVFGGTALIKRTDLTGNRIGLLVHNDGENIGIADAGQIGGGPSSTGLGDSPGQNIFTGYVASSLDAGAIVNLNDLAGTGSRGPLLDVPAWNNTFTGPIEDAIYHDLDDAAYGFVDYAMLRGPGDELVLELSGLAIAEGGTTRLSGSFENLPQYHRLAIDWGDDQAEVIELAPGIFDFDVAHVYGDGGPGEGTLYTISASVAESAYSQQQLGGSSSVSVANVAPTAQVTGQQEADEGADYALMVDGLFDPGDDQVQLIVVSWGDGSTSSHFDPRVSLLPYTITHTYDDGPAVRTIRATVIDEDGSYTVGTHDVAVNNVAPTVLPFAPSRVEEGTDAWIECIVLPDSDPSASDREAGFTFGFDFNNDGDFDDPLEIDPALPGSTSSSVIVPGVYLADGPQSTIRMVIRDKDGGQTERLTTIALDNVAPVVNAGLDVTGLAGKPLLLAGTFLDPGNDDWTVTVDFGDGSPAVPLAVLQREFSATHQYAQPGNYTITISVDDGDGAVGIDTVEAVVYANTLQVIQFAPAAGGFDLQLNRDVDLSVLNLYDGVDEPVDLPDVTLVGAAHGPVIGSMVFAVATRTMRFLAGDGSLLPDTYTATLVSGVDAWRDTLGQPLDGDADHLPGGDYIATFTVEPSENRLVYLPAVARGPGQPINMPATETDWTIWIDQASGVTAVDFDLRYDPALLEITAAELSNDLRPVQGMSGWSLTQNAVRPGLLKVTLSGTTALQGTSPSGQPVGLLTLTANVPGDAPYGASQIVELVGLRVNEGNIPATAGDALQHVAYLGDADGNELYSGLDAALISRTVVRIDSGFDAHPLIDPRIIGDTTGDGTLSGLDASYVAQRAVGMSRPEIPEIPAAEPKPSPLAAAAVDLLLATYWR